VWVTAGNVWTTVTRAEPAEFEFLSEYLSWEAPEHQRQLAAMRTKHAAACARARAEGRPPPGLWLPAGDGKHRLYDSARRRFPSGLLTLVQREARGRGIDVLRADERTAINPSGDVGVATWLRPYQQEAVVACLLEKRGVVKMGTGGGKCLGRNIPILMADGAVRAVQLVRRGDLLMGPTGPRRVFSTSVGRGPMFIVRPTKGEPWVCNDVHVLTLVHTRSGAVLDVALNEYLRKSKKWKYEHKLLRSGVEEFIGPVRRPLDPYFLGAWLGDGRSDLAQGVCVTTEDHRVLNMLRELFGNGLACDAKFIPREFKCASKEARLQLLAGLIDTDGSLHNSGFDFISKSSQLANDVAYVARSLGLAAYVRTCQKEDQNGTRGTYFRVGISGDCSIVPTRLPRKRAAKRTQRKDVLRTGFTVEPVGERDYYGFTLDGDGRFLLGDFTVTHNTEVFTALAHLVPCRWVVLVTQKDLLTQTRDRILLRTGEEAGIVGDGRWDERRITIAMTQTLHDKLDQPRVQALLGGAGGMIVDECHGLGAPREYKVAMACTGAGYRLGFSGSPFARGDKRNAYVIAATGPKIYDLSAAELVEMGSLTKVEVVMVPLRQSLPAGLSWMEAYERGIAASEARNRLLVAIAAQAQKPALLYVKQLDHGRALQRLLQKAGVPCAFVWGKWKSSEREGAIKRLERGDAQVLVTNLFEQGTDIPSLRDVIVGAGGKSAIKAVQRPGRAMRLSEGKQVARLYDVDDMGQVWLDRHAAQRAATYVREGHRVVRMDRADAQMLVLKK
jgi:superfamily II DNA or RNA helicase